METCVAALLDQQTSVQFDFAEQVALPFPIMVITKVMGIDGERWPDLKLWTEMIVGHHNRDNQYPGSKAFVALHALFSKEILDRRSHPRDDLISKLVHADVEGTKLTDTEIITFCNTLLVAGNETTASLISNMVNVLAVRPKLWARLREDRSLIDRVIEETPRFDSPVQFASRKVAQKITVCEQSLSKDDRIIVCIGAANRDPDVFADPNTFLPERRERNHLAFSHGIHFCVGAALTRLEAKVVLSSLLDR
jgi:cytochrome P450